MSAHILKLSAICASLCFFTMGCSSNPHALEKKKPQQTITVNEVTADGVGAKIGTISFKDSPQGLIIQTNLSELSSGFHGFHIHEKGSCQPAEKDGKMGAALAAGSHFNPNGAASGHGSPNDGHLGDLPVLNVDSTGVAKTSVIAPRLKLADIQGLAIIIHAGGDNYSDHPKPLGGGGDRIACGVIR